MKTVRAYNCIRDGGRDSAKQGNVVFLLDETHAAHTLRTFLSLGAVAAAVAAALTTRPDDREAARQPIEVTQSAV